MVEKYSKTVTILPSQVDPTGRLSVPHTFDLFMDTATEAAEALGVGWNFLRRQGMFWITVKTRARFVDRPRLLDVVEVSTWPERPDGRRCNRHYEIRRDGELLAQGKTEWAIVDMRTLKQQEIARLLPEGLTYAHAPACTEPFPMIDETFPDEPFAEHRVTCTDIDMARHMNNVAYIRAVMDGFSVKTWQALDVRQMDIIFRASAHEGNTLLLQRREGPDGLDIRGSLPDGGTVFLSRIRAGQEAE